MTLDIRGGLKNKTINHSSYVALEEMLSNAIDSYLIRRNREPNAPPFSVDFHIEIISTALFDDGFDVHVSCADNGAGFGDEQVKAFVTMDSTYKDYLKIQGIGKCKGVGRIQYFHHFKRLSIRSVYSDGDQKFQRTLNVEAETREISEQSFAREVTDEPIGTTVTLKDRRIQPASDEHNDEGVDAYSCYAVVAHLYTAFLQRLIILKGLIGDFSIGVKETRGTDERQEFIRSDSLPKPVEKIALPLLCEHGETPRSGQSLQVTHYSFESEEFQNFQHEVALCANAAIVQPVTKEFIKNAAARKRPIGGRFELILVESAELERSVNQQRDGFDIPEKCTSTSDFDGKFSLEDVLQSLEDYVYKVIAPEDFNRADLVNATEQKFGITSSMLDCANIKVHYGDTAENIAKRVLKKFQEDIVNDTSKLFDVKQELLKLDPRSEGFRERVNELSWRYTSTIRKMDMANLSQLVVRRTAMIQVLRHAVDGLLDCQNIAKGERKQNESIIHNVFFPRYKDSTEVQDHDIWLLNEEYQYFEHITSDKPLSTLAWVDGDKLFDADVDVELLEMFKKNNDENGSKRPDIALFTAEGAAVIIELKAPDVPLQEHANDLVEYARLLASKSNGRITKFYGYLIGGTIDENRISTDWKPFANGKGFFATGPLIDHRTRIPYGELYSEMLYYHDFIDRAELRLEVYKKKLNVEL